MSMEIGTDEEPQHWHEDIGDDVSGRLNWLRAGVLGANDGIVSTAGVVMGVAGATDDSATILIAGIAALTAGALSMAPASTSRSAPNATPSAPSSRWSDRAAADARDRAEELARMYRDKGLSKQTAALVAAELTEHNALEAHADIEFGIDANALANPWHAAIASMLAFTVGALIPLLVVAFVPDSARIITTVVTVVLALAVAGAVSAKLGYSPRLPAIARNVGGGLLAMGVTYLIGSFAGLHLG